MYPHLRVAILVPVLSLLLSLLLHDPCYAYDPPVLATTFALPIYSGSHFGPRLFMTACRYLTEYLAVVPCTSAAKPATYYKPRPLYAQRRFE